MFWLSYSWTLSSLTVKHFEDLDEGDTIKFELSQRSLTAYLISGDSFRNEIKYDLGDGKVKVKENTKALYFDSDVTIHVEDNIDDLYVWVLAKGTCTNFMALSIKKEEGISISTSNEMNTCLFLPGKGDDDTRITFPSDGFEYVDQTFRTHSCQFSYDNTCHVDIDDDMFGYMSVERYSQGKIERPWGKNDDHEFRVTSLISFYHYDTNPYSSGKVPFYGSISTIEFTDWDHVGAIIGYTIGSAAIIGIIIVTIILCKRKKARQAMHLDSNSIPPTKSDKIEPAPLIDHSQNPQGNLQYPYVPNQPIYPQQPMYQQPQQAPMPSYPNPYQQYDIGPNPYA